MADIVLFGIPNCDTVKKARTWLQEQEIAFDFHDFKKAGLTRDAIQAWLPHVGTELLINRKGTTWRALSDEQKTAADELEGAIALMLASPSVIKRPVLQISDKQKTFVAVGFSPAQYQTFFK